MKKQADEVIDQAEHLAVVAGESDSEATDSDTSSVVHRSSFYVFNNISA